MTLASPPAPRQVAAQVRALLDAEGSPFDLGFPRTWDHNYFTVTSNRKRREVRVEWSTGMAMTGPSEAEVASVVAPLCEEAGISMVLVRQRAWSCGHFHADDEEAWEMHNAGLATLEGACACCGAGGEYVITEAAKDAHRDAQGRLVPPCRRGNFARCPNCGGHGVTVDLKDKPVVQRPCAPCQGRGVFDLDQDEQRERYVAQLDELRAEAWREFEAETKTASRP